MVRAEGRYVAFGELLYRKDAKATVIHIYDRRSKKESYLPNSEGLWSARWSPDGQFIAAVTSDSTALRIFDVRKTKRTELARFHAFENPAWTQDSAMSLRAAKTV